MLPTSSNLTALVNKTITLDPKLTTSPTGDGVLVKEFPVTLEVNGNAVSLTKGEGSDPGLWVPYAETMAVVGYATGGQTWAASGPFSGCEFIVGSNKKLGIPFAAHIARQSGSTAVEDWKKYEAAQSLSVWYQNRIPLPSDTFYACSYVFVQFGGTGILSMVRLDVNVGNRMGGSDGVIFNVKTFK